MAAPLATVSLTITRGSGVSMNASATVPDELVMDMAGMIGAMIFDASYAEPEVQAERPAGSV